MIRQDHGVTKGERNRRRQLETSKTHKRQVASFYKDQPVAQRQRILRRQTGSSLGTVNKIHRERLAQAVRNVAYGRATKDWAWGNRFLLEHGYYGVRPAADKTPTRERQMAKGGYFEADLGADVSASSKSIGRTKPVTSLYRPGKADSLKSLRAEIRSLEAKGLKATETRAMLKVLEAAQKTARMG